MHDSFQDGLAVLDWMTLRHSAVEISERLSLTTLCRPRSDAPVAVTRRAVATLTSSAARTARDALARTRRSSASPCATWSSPRLFVISRRRLSTTVRLPCSYWILRSPNLYRVCNPQALPQNRLLRVVRYPLTRCVWRCIKKKNHLISYLQSYVSARAKAVATVRLRRASGGRTERRSTLLSSPLRRRSRRLPLAHELGCWVSITCVLSFRYACLTSIIKCLPQYVVGVICITEYFPITV
jgi:hypothetical protein